MAVLSNVVVMIGRKAKREEGEHGPRTSVTLHILVLPGDREEKPETTCWLSCNLNLKTVDAKLGKL